MACRDRVGQLQDEFPSRSPKVDMVEHVLRMHLTTGIAESDTTAFRGLSDHIHPQWIVLRSGLY